MIEGKKNRETERIGLKKHLKTLMALMTLLHTWKPSMHMCMKQNSRQLFCFMHTVKKNMYLYLYKWVLLSQHRGSCCQLWIFVSATTWLAHTFPDLAGDWLHGRLNGWPVECDSWSSTKVLLQARIAIWQWCWKASKHLLGNYFK